MAPTSATLKLCWTWWILFRPRNTLKGQCHEIFYPRFFPLGPWFAGWSRFSPRKSIRNRQNWCHLHRGFYLFCQSSPLIFKFSSNYMFVMFSYLFISFCYGFPLKGMRANNRFCEGSRGVIKIFMVSLRLRNRLHKCPIRIPQSHWDCGIRTLQTIISIFSANTKLCANRL
jgi:hypothetical protein